MDKIAHYNWRIKNDGINIFVDTKIYPQEPLYATCYVFIDDYYIFLDLVGNSNKYKISITPKDSQREKINFSKLAGEFQNELVSNTLRYKIALRNKKIREWIVKEALFFSQSKKEQRKSVQRLREAEKSGKAKN